ncbi:MAG: hypothetical protein NTU49_07515 [Gammaproteobacteria bacterium]|nr:hypothetical protein [Gammaproteobacteria bacterium]
MKKKLKKAVSKSAKKTQIKYLEFDDVLDAEEQELVDSVERGEWKAIDNFEEVKAELEAAARNHIRKEARVTFRISNGDLMLLKQKAAKKGLSYQTFIASILHQYAAGDLQEKAV